MSQSDEDDINYEEEELEPRARGVRGDSPDFNRNDYVEEDDDTSNLTSTTYDLTVSANAHPHPTHRDDKAAVVTTSSNRTFADSVLNHNQQ